MTTHLRTDNEPLNADRTFACGLGPDLPESDLYVFEAERVLHHKVDCEGCLPRAEPIGTPLSELSSQPGTPGYARFLEISGSWGYP